MKQTVAPTRVWIECRACLRSFLVSVGFALNSSCPVCGALESLRQLEPMELAPRRELYENLLEQALALLRADAPTSPAVSTPEKKEEKL